MIIKIKKGCLYGLLESIDKKYLDNIPDDYKINQQNRDNNKYHITIIQSNELKNIDYIENEVNIKYFNLGLSKLQKDKNEVYYLYIYSNDLNDIRKKFNLEEQVEFFGKVSDEKLVELYSQALVVTHLVKEAPFGLIVTESMSCGTPVIAWKPGGPEEIIVHDETGFLIEENDEKNLIRYIEKFLDSPNLSNDMGLNARNRSTKFFNLLNHHKQMRDHLQYWINKKS